MLPRRYSDNGVVLLRRNYSEADRILVVFSRKYGKLRFMAKGVRKPSSRKRGHIEIFSHFKFSASRGKGLDILTETEEIQSFKDIRKNLKKTSVAYFAVETVGRIAQDEEKNERLFFHLVNTLNGIVKSENLRKLRRDFIYKTLVISGYWPPGKAMKDHDRMIESVIERKISSSRIGKKLLT